MICTPRAHWRTVAAGGLFTLGLLAAGAASAQTTVNGELTAADPVFNRPSTSTPCTLNPGVTAAHYDVYPLTHPGGTLTIELRGASSGSGTLSDPYLHLYSGSFDPASPCTNWVEGDDDGGDVGFNSLISGTYPAGTYVIVATSFGSGATGTYQLTYNATPPASATPVPTLGQWGLVGLSLALGAAALRRRRS